MMIEKKGGRREKRKEQEEDEKRTYIYTQCIESKLSNICTCIHDIFE